MSKICSLVFASLIFCSCSESNNKTANNDSNKKITIYSATIQDSFVISVQLPEAYNKDSDTKFPVVYMLDANFHFPMLAATVKQYEKAGLLPPLILTGIGYKSFELMDSLRVRDYLYPAALPSDEMNAVGGGKKFADFIISQLIPYIDSNYHTDKTNRSLVGHSFGGYFSLYALLNQMETKRTDFKNFVSASPSLWYNNFYLDRLTNHFKKADNKNSLNIFLSVGGLEDSTWNISPVRKFARQIDNGGMKNINFQYKIYNDLGHMDMAQLSFIKGLQQFYNKNND